MLMDPRKLIVVLLGLAVLTLSGCRGDAADNPADGDSETMDYRGATIHCTEPGSGNSSVLSCDFVRFYVDNPELLRDTQETTEDNVYWLKEQGYSLPCLKKGSGESKRISCDWDRFYAIHPELSGRPR